MTVYNHTTHRELVDKVPGIDDVRVLVAAFDRDGFEVRLVGGVVRDLLSGATPKDVDLATDATPEQMMKVGEDNGFTVVPTGLQHGTVTFVINHVPYEVTTLRVDTETDGRHATVAWTTSFEQDAARRDLTFNAMSMDLNGTLYDYFDGLKDLTNKTVRFVGDADQRLTEDELRSLRYFRFFARMGAEDIDRDTQRALKRHAPMLKRVSGERVWMEMSKILPMVNSSPVLSWMDYLGYSEQMGVFSTTRPHGLTHASNSSPATVLAALVDTPDAAEKLVKDWKMSAADRDLLRYLVKNRDVRFDTLAGVVEMTNGVSRAWVVERYLLGGQSDLAGWAQSVDVPVFPVTGQDLLDRGVAPGKAMGEMLRTMKKRWQDEQFWMTKTDLMNTVGFLW